MRRTFVALLIVLAFMFGNLSFAGDSTSLNPYGSDSGHDINTSGGDIKTEGGKVDTGSGDVHTNDVHANDVYGDVRSYRAYIRHLYGKGSSWIDSWDHFDMNDNVIYDTRRVRVNDTWPSRNDELASKRYVDAKSSSRDNDCFWTRGSALTRPNDAWHTIVCPNGYYMKGYKIYATSTLDGGVSAYCCR